MKRSDDIREYRLLMKANNLKNVDRDYRVHQLAWLTNAAQAVAKGVLSMQSSRSFLITKMLSDRRLKEERSRFDGIGHLLKGGR